MEAFEKALEVLFTNFTLRVSMDPQQIPGWDELSKIELCKEWDGELLPYGTVLKFNRVYTFGTPIHLIYLIANKEMPGTHFQDGLLCSKSEFDDYIRGVEKTLIELAYFAELCKSIPFFGQYVPQLVDFGMEGMEFKFVLRKSTAAQPLLGEPAVLREIKAQLPRLYAIAQAGRSSRLEVHTLGRNYPSLLMRKVMPNRAEIGPMRRAHLWSWWNKLK